MRIGENIRKLRKDLGITQKKLAELVGVTPGAIKKYERNEREPNLKILDKLSEALNVELSELLTTKININGLEVAITEDVTYDGNPPTSLTTYVNETKQLLEGIDDLNINNEMSIFTELLKLMGVSNELSVEDYPALYDATKAFIEFEIYKLKKGRD